jgi:superfamily II DNA or RNA helicase
LAAGKIEIVTNCQVLTEGFDCPDIGCLILARPTKSLGLYRQMIGRALRPAPGKDDAVILDHAGAVFMHGLPDDPIEWSLAEDRRAENKAHAARGTHKAPALVDCPECHAVRFQGAPCPACGWRPRPKPAPVDVADGELAAVDWQRRTSAITYNPNERQKFYSQLLWIADERGYKSGWAWHKFQEKFKTLPPPRKPEPTPPDEVVRAWVRSRAIAYAKSMEKQRGGP